MFSVVLNKISEMTWFSLITKQSQSKMFSPLTENHGKFGLFWLGSLGYRNMPFQLVEYRFSLSNNGICKECVMGQHQGQPKNS